MLLLEPTQSSLPEPALEPPLRVQELLPASVLVLVPALAPPPLALQAF